MSMLWVKIFNLLYLNMVIILSKEQFKEKLENKRKKLLEQRAKRIAEEIVLILKWIDMNEYSKEDQLNFQESARHIAEKKSYTEDYNLTILENIKNSSEENHYWEDVNVHEWINIFSNIENDVVYRRMVEKWDLENIKLFLERKLPEETYYNYLTDIEIKEIWNEDPNLLKRQLEKQAEDSSMTIEQNNEWDKNQEEEQQGSEENLNEEQVTETMEQEVDEETWEDETKGKKTDKEDSNNPTDSWSERTLSDEDLFRINNAIKYFKDNWMEIKDCDTVQDIISQIKAQIYSHSWIARNKWNKVDFLKNNNWVVVEEKDIPKNFKPWDQFNVYCACALDWCHIEIKIQPAKSIEKKKQPELPYFIFINLEWIKRTLKEYFNSDMEALKEYIDKYFTMRKSWFIAFSAKIPYGWYGPERHEQNHKNLAEKLKEMYSKNPEIKKCSIYMGKEFVNKILESRDTTAYIKLRQLEAFREKLLDDSWY